MNTELSSIYLGIDIGTTSAKCLAVDESGEVIALGQYPYPMKHPQQGWAEQDPEDYWRGLVHTVHLCVEQCRNAGRHSDDIAALALSTQGNTVILCDSHGVPLIPAISWMDGRSSLQFDRLVSQTSLPFWYNTVGVRLTALSPAPKVLWLQENCSEYSQRDSRLCMVPDYLAMKLCGKFAMDLPSASWTPFFSPIDRAWSKPALDVLNLPQEKLSDVVESGEAIGDILPEVADELGLRRGVRLISGAFDQASAAHGSGARAGSRCTLSCGTAWVLYAPSYSLLLNGKTPIPICCHVGRDTWGMVMPFSGGSVYDWCLRTFSESSDEPSDADALIFIPHLYGGLSPDFHTESRASILGLTMAHTPADIRLAVMRGLAYESRRNMEAAESLAGSLGSLSMVGGATKSDVWPQIIANVLAREVEVPSLSESACYGAAAIAAGSASAGWSGFRARSRVSPDPVEIREENSRYERYLRAYELLLTV